MRKRDFHKTQAVKHDSDAQWELHKSERNKVNVQMRQAKSKYFCEKIENSSKDVKKSWSLINTLLEIHACSYPSHWYPSNYIFRT